MNLLSTYLATGVVTPLADMGLGDFRSIAIEAGGPTALVTGRYYLGGKGLMRVTLATGNVEELERQPTHFLIRAVALDWRRHQVSTMPLATAKTSPDPRP